MKSTTVLLIAILVVSIGCASKPATGSDPLTGKWNGKWGPSAERQTEVVLDLHWDGTTLKGTIDPDRRALEVKKGTFDAKTNAIHMEVDAPLSGGGEMDHYT